MPERRNEKKTRREETGGKKNTKMVRASGFLNGISQKLAKGCGVEEEIGEHRRTKQNRKKATSLKPFKIRREKISCDARE